MTWRELAEDINEMSDERIDNPVSILIFGKQISIKKDCEFMHSKENIYFSNEWDEYCMESELGPEDINDPDVHVICEAGEDYIFTL